MDNATLLYVGMFCFAMTGLGVALTAYEFKKLSPTPPKASNGVEPEASAIVRTAHVVELQ